MNTSANVKLSPWPFVPNLLLLSFMIAVSVHFAAQLPDLVPTNFNLQGQPIAHGSRAVVLSFLPIIYALDLLLLPLLIFYSTKDSSPRMQKLVGKANTAVGALFASIHLGFLTHSANPQPGLLESWIVGGIALFMLFLAPVFSEVEPNKFMGVRTPWTLASRKNWDATHKFASKVAALTGILLLIANLLARPSLFLALATLVFSMLVPVFYSLWYYQNLEAPSSKPPEA